MRRSPTRAGTAHSRLPAHLVDGASEDDRTNSLADRVVPSDPAAQAGIALAAHDRPSPAIIDALQVGPVRAAVEWALPSNRDNPGFASPEPYHGHVIPARDAVRADLPAPPLAAAPKTDRPGSSAVPHCFPFCPTPIHAADSPCPEIEPFLSDFDTILRHFPTILANLGQFLPLLFPEFPDRSVGQKFPLYLSLLGFDAPCQTCERSERLSRRRL